MSRIPGSLQSTSGSFETFRKMMAQMWNVLATAFNGNISFGDGTNIDNINGTWITVTTPGSANTNFTVNHNLNRLPAGYLPMSKSAACDVYTGSVAATNTTLTLRATVAGVALKLFVFGLLLFLPLVVKAQNDPYFHDIALYNNGTAAVPVAGAQVTVCNTIPVTTPITSFTCSPLAQLYSNSIGTIPLAQPLTADANGNFGFYAAAGSYIVIVSGAAVGPYAYPVTLSNPGNSSGAVLGNYGQSFIGQQTVTLLATNTGAVSANLIGACYDGSGNRIDEMMTINPSTFNITFTFFNSQTGYCVSNVGGSAGGGGGGGGGTPQVYPPAGIPQSTGTAWDVSIPAPTAPINVPQLVASTPTSGGPQKFTTILQGIVPRGVSGTSGTDTVQPTDCTSLVRYQTTVNVAVTLNTPSSMQVPNCVFRLINASTTNTVTVTSTGGWTINNAATYTIQVAANTNQPQVVQFELDPFSVTDWSADLLTAGSGSGSTPASPNGSLQYNNSGALGGSIFIYSPTSSVCPVACGGLSTTTSGGIDINSTDGSGEVTILASNDSGAVGNTLFSMFTQTVANPNPIGISSTVNAGGTALGGNCQNLTSGGASTPTCGIGNFIIFGDNPSDTNSGQDSIGTVWWPGLNKASGSMHDLIAAEIWTVCPTATPGSCPAIGETISHNQIGLEIQDMQGRGTNLTAGIHIEAQTNAGANNYAIKLESGAGPTQLQALNAQASTVTTLNATTSATSPSITDSSLTSGNCVQPTTGGLLASTSLPCTGTVASGTAAMGTSAIASGACSSVVTVSATGVATTDVIERNPNGDPTGVTGYGPSATGSLYIWAWPTANNVNFKVCNNTGSSITPGALTLNWRVTR